MTKIAIMGAMPEEIEPILLNIENIKKVSYASNIYYEGTYKGKEIVVAYSKIGKVFSALTTTILMEKFNCDVLLFSGVAGGISNELKIGDIIVADKLCQHDVDITSFGHPHGFIPESSKYIETDNHLKYLAKSILEKEKINHIFGIIATGDQFISSQNKKKWISDEFKADAIEMEGASVAIVCNSMNIPFFILRTISDTADSEAIEDFPKFMNNAAKKSAKVILSMIERI